MSFPSPYIPFLPKQNIIFLLNVNPLSINPYYSPAKAIIHLASSLFPANLPSHGAPPIHFSTSTISDLENNNHSYSHTQIDPRPNPTISTPKTHCRYFKKTDRRYSRRNMRWYIRIYLYRKSRRHTTLLFFIWLLVCIQYLTLKIWCR
jgi:hypothetical protein